MSAQPRFDVIFDENGFHLDYHFCREWDADGSGCYGTNQNHGYSWDEARAQMAELHECEAAKWRAMRIEEWDPSFVSKDTVNG